MHTTGNSEFVQTIVIGGGQAGLSVGYHLARRGLPFLILDANERTGDSWRKRWDSLRLFTPARYDGLPGMPYPAPVRKFPTKDEMADYLCEYAARFDLPVRTGTRVERLERVGDRFALTAGDQHFEADNVIVAMSSWQQPLVPSFASTLSPDIVQMHSSEYRHPAQFREGGVLVVGAGNSGAEIALEAARSHPTWLAGNDTGHVPFDIEGAFGRFLGVRVVVGFVFHHVLTLRTPIGRKEARKGQAHGMPLVRTKPKDIAAAGIERVPRVSGVGGGRPVLEDGRALEVSNVVWSTGYSPGFSWIELPIWDEQGLPRHDRGSVTEQPGLYFVGLPFLYAASSSMVHGVGRDAERIAGAVAVRSAATQSPWYAGAASTVA